MPTALGAALYEAKFSLVSTIIPPTDWRYSSAPAKKAIEKQMKAMVDHGVWDPDSLCEASDVQGPAEFVGGKLLLGIKGAESLGNNQDKETVQWKARFVCTGNFISDANGRKIYEFDSPFAMPIDLASVRAVIYYGAQHRCILQADVLTAYLLAKLGGPPTWIRLPRWALPAAAQGMKDPVMRLHKALYGHPRSGGDWDQHLGRVLRAQGWVPVEGVLSLWRSPCGECVLAIYVDDLLCSGPRMKAVNYLKELHKFVQLAGIEDLNKFLGTVYTAQYGDALSKITISQADYSGLLLDRYKKRITVQGPLKALDTPMMSEPDLDATNERKPAPTHILSDLGGLLFLARSSRPDIAHAVAFLGRYSHDWSKALDAKLHRLLQYLEGTRKFELTWTIKHGDVPTSSL